MAEGAYFSSGEKFVLFVLTQDSSAQACLRISTSWQLAYVFSWQCCFPPVLQERSGHLQGCACWRQGKRYLCLRYLRPRYFLTVHISSVTLNLVAGTELLSFHRSVWWHHQRHHSHCWWVGRADPCMIPGSATLRNRMCVWHVYRCICLWAGAAVHSRGH